MHGRGATNLLIADHGSGVGVYKMVFECSYSISLWFSHFFFNRLVSILKLELFIMIPDGSESSIV